MKIFTQTLTTAFIAILLLSFGKANAQAVVHLDDPAAPEKATSITVLDVNGTVYDVTFSDLAEAGEVYGDFETPTFTFTNLEDAEAAVTAMNTAFNAASVIPIRVGIIDGNQGWPNYYIGYDTEMAGEVQNCILTGGFYYSDLSTWGFGFELGAAFWNGDGRTWALFTPSGTGWDCPDIEANIGDVCDDGDESTENDMITENCECAGTPVWDCPELEANIGDACDDGDESTEDDMITENCECVGTPIWDCPELEANIGDACDDGDESTEDDIVGDDCICAGTPISTGINEELLGVSISVYPNPASNVLNIDAGNDVHQVTLINPVGQVVYDAVLEANKTSIDLSKFSVGVYMVQLKKADGTVLSTQKVIIK